jgi:hypothetical protein
MDLTIGDTFKSQIEAVAEPHRFEGYVYETPSDLVMFCQIGYGLFAFINLLDGNRMNDGVQMRFENIPELGGCNARGVLRKMQHDMDCTLTCKGKLNKWLSGLE